MTACQRPTANALIVALLVSSIGSSGCTSMKPVKPITAPGPPRFADVQVGDTVSFVAKGQKVRFIVASMEGDSLTSSKGVRYQRTDVTELRRRSRDWVKTGVLLGGLGFVAFVYIGAAILAS